MGVIQKNLIYQVITQAGSKGLMFIVYMLLARMLGPELYGAFDYAFAYVQIIGGIFFEMGLILIVTRELSNNNLDIFSPALWLKGAGCLFGSLLIFMFGIILNIQLTLVLFLLLFTIFNSFTNLYICIFRASNRMDGEAITVIAQRALLVFVLFLLFIEFIDLPNISLLNKFAIAFCCSALFGFILAFYRARHIFHGLIIYEGITKIYPKVIILIKEAFPLIGVSVFWLIYYKIDIVILGLLSTKEEVGFYSAAYKILEASFLIPMIITNAIYPRLSQLWSSNIGGFLRVFKKSSIILLFLGILATIIISIIAHPIIELLFGIHFSPVNEILPILIFTLVAVYPGQLVTHSLVIIGKQKKFLFISIIAASSNILLNFILIPKYGAKGAALSTAITEGLVTILAAVIVLKYIIMKNNENENRD